MEESFQKKYRQVFIVSPTESVLTKQGNRHPSLASYLIERGQKVVYYSSNFYHAEKRKFSKEELLKAKNETKYELNIVGCLGYKNNVSIARVVNNTLLAINTFLLVLKRANSNDIIILPSRPVEFILLFSLIKRIKKCDLILDVEDIWPDALIINNKIKKWVFDTYCNIQLKASIRFYDKFLTISPSYKEWIKRYKGNNKISFLPLGFEAYRWNEISYNKTEGKSKIEFGLIAVLQLQVDILPFIRAIKNDARYNLKIIGEDGKGQRYGEVMEYINKHKVKNVTFIGRVPKLEVQNYLKSFDIGVSPIISRLLPNKFFDYMACYLPMMSMGNEDMQYMIQKYNIGWACDNKEEEIKKCLDSIDFNKIQLYRENILKVRHQFEREKINESIYNFILN